LEELIQDNHVVRVLTSVIDQLNMDDILKKYKGDGASSYDPKLIFKILIYGYLSHIYSSRKTE